jgi:hypothetical protein
MLSIATCRTATIFVIRLLFAVRLSKATRPLSILSYETNESREQRNRKLMRIHTEPAPGPSGHAV